MTGGALVPVVAPAAGVTPAPVVDPFVAGDFDPGVPAFPPAGRFGVGPVPLLLVHGDADRGNPYERSRAAYAAARAPKYLLTIIGGDHRRPYQTDPARSKAARAVARVTVDFLDLSLRGDAAAAARLTRDGAVAHVARLESAT